MCKTYFYSLLENTKEAKKQWEEFARTHEHVDDFKKRFHLRPTGSGVTIVTTIPEKPMRGKKVGKTTVMKCLDKLYSITMSNMAEIKKLELLTQLQFEERKQDSSKKREEFYQAKMIAEMAENQSLKDFLKVDELIFIASEFILHDQSDKSNRERIDIIGYDGKNRLFFFELKDPINPKGDPLEQVSKYVDKYGGAKREEVLELLGEYPIHAVSSNDITIEGCAVYGYGEKVNLSESNEVICGEKRLQVIKF